MLVNTASSSVGNNAKQISVNSLATTGGTVFYTVPAGKKFIGYVTIQAYSSSYSFFSINGVQHNVALGGSYGGSTAMSNQLTLLSGTTVAPVTTGQYLSLVGIESDV